MNFYLIGVDYQSAPLEIREEINLRRKEISAFWQIRKPKEIAILSTCNRIEIYGLAKDFNDFLTESLDFKQCFKGLFENAYTKFGKAGIFEHLLLLACGLKSQLLGEIQILQQLKVWSVQEYLPPALSELLKQVLPLAEDIRRQAGLNRETINVANIVFGDLVNRMGIKPSMEIIVVGTGKIAQLVVLYRPDNARLHFISHKRYLKAQLLAKRASGTVHGITDLPDLLSAADALISATSSPHYVIHEKHFLNVQVKRKQPVYLYDLAVPRDIDPSIGSFGNVFLQNINDLSALFVQENQLRKPELNLAEYLVRETVDKYKDGWNVQGYSRGHAAQQIGHKTI
jgi:glutamyl-tRNA reductase